MIQSGNYSNNTKIQDQRWTEYIGNLQNNLEIPFDTILTSFQSIFHGRTKEDGPPVVWQPNPDRIKKSNLYGLMSTLGFDSYDSFHAWTVEHRDLFWSHVIRGIGLIFHTEPEKILDLDDGTRNPVCCRDPQGNSLDTNHTC